MNKILCCPDRSNAQAIMSSHPESSNYPFAPSGCFERPSALDFEKKKQ
jgi:hypothetical protein